MFTHRISRASARRSFSVSFSAALILGASFHTPVFAADPSCETKSAGSSRPLPAPGSNEAWEMAKFPWLYLPKAPVTPVTTHFPEPGSAEAVKFYKTPYLTDRRPSAPAEGSGKHWPTPGSAEAVMFWKTPYLMNRRSAAGSSCP